MSDDEQYYNDHPSAFNEVPPRARRLINILQKERDAWMGNAKAYDKARMEAEKQLALAKLVING